MTLPFNRPSDALSASIAPGCTLGSKTIRNPPLNPSQIDPMACPACGHVPAPTNEEVKGQLWASLREFTERTTLQARRFVLEELDRCRRQQGATVFWITVAYDARCRHPGDLPVLHEWDVERAFRHFEQAGVVGIRPLGKTGKDAKLKGRLLINSRELAMRLDDLVGIATAGV